MAAHWGNKTREFCAWHPPQGKKNSRVLCKGTGRGSDLQPSHFLPPGLRTRRRRFSAGVMGAFASSDVGRRSGEAIELNGVGQTPEVC